MVRAALRKTLPVIVVGIALTFTIPVAKLTGGAAGVTEAPSTRNTVVDPCFASLPVLPVHYTVIVNEPAVLFLMK